LHPISAQQVPSKVMLGVSDPEGIEICSDVYHAGSGT
jgi:hypothetical protein